MRKILFVCHGNICRSPMAEYICKYFIQERKLDMECASRAVSTEEIGNDIYPPAKEVLSNHHIPFDRHYAKRINAQDYEYYDEIYVMDESNLRNIHYLLEDKENKIHKLSKEDIEDPWYTGNYELVYKEIQEGIENLLSKLYI